MSGTWCAFRVRIASLRSSTEAFSKSPMPLGDMNAFSPTTPASMSALSFVWLRALSGTSPPQNATSTWSLFALAFSFRSKVSASTTVGLELSGMSTSVVTPPAAAALVPVSKPSQCTRPGSLRWT